MKMMQRMSRGTKRGPKMIAGPIMAAFILLSASPVVAGYLNVIVQERLPRETSRMIAELKELEPYIGGWEPTWSYEVSKDDVRTRIGALMKDAEELSAKGRDNGELHLLCGLIAFYGYNVDLEGTRERADLHFAAAQKLMPDDYRPSWFLGMHLYKSTRTVDGMKALLEAEKKASIRDELFWDDYALAAYGTGMIGHSLKALDKCRELTGKASGLDEVMGAKIREMIKIPAQGTKMEPEDLWQFDRRGEAVQILSYPFGYKFLARPKCEEYLWYTGFDGKAAALKVRLSPRTGAGGDTIIPTVQVLTMIAPGKGTAEGLAKLMLGGSKKMQKFDMGLGLGEAGYMIDDPENYKEDGGTKMVVIAFARDCPRISRLSLEELYDITGGQEPKSEPTFFRLSPGFGRFKERLFYIIGLETPTNFFDQSLAEFKDILSTFVVE